MVGLPNLGVVVVNGEALDSMVGLPDLGVVVVNGGALDSVVELADLGLIFYVPGDFLPISLASLFRREVYHHFGLILCTGVEVGFELILCLFVYWG